MVTWIKLSEVEIIIITMTITMTMKEGLRSIYSRQD